MTLNEIEETIGGLEDCERIIGESAESWGSRCFEIAHKLCKEWGIGRTVYGHWIGEVAPGTFFYDRALVGFVQHGWIDVDGTIIDPTRWVFEGEEPYIYLCASDQPGVRDYDEGGNVFREAMLKNRPIPEWIDGEEEFELQISEEARYLMSSWFENDRDPQKYHLMWIANLPYPHFNGMASEFYTALRDAGFGAFVPIDNYDKAMGVVR